MAESSSPQDSGLRVQSTRTKRLSKDELRALVLEAGASLLGDGGVTVSLHHLNMEDLIRQVGVPRSSAFAAFGGKEELLTELMVQLLRPEEGGRAGLFAETVRVAGETMARHAHRARRADGTRDPEGTRAVVREAIRLTLPQNVEETMSSTHWQTFLALAATVPSLPPGRRERVAEALRIAEAQFSEGMTEFYAGAFAQMGLRPRPGVHWHHVVTAGAAIVEAVVSRRRMGAPIADEPILAPGIDGEPVEWTFAALAYLAMIEGLTEPDE